MKLKFLDAKQFEPNMKCTVQGNGKLNFSAASIHVLGLHNQKSIKFAVPEEGKGGDDLYLLVQDNITDDAFKVNKAGNYFYLNAKALFDSFGFDYKSQTVVFDIVKTDTSIDGVPVYRLNRRKGKSRKAR